MKKGSGRKVCTFEGATVVCHLDVSKTENVVSTKWMCMMERIKME